MGEQGDRDSGAEGVLPPSADPAGEGTITDPARAPNWPPKLSHNQPLLSAITKTIRKREIKKTQQSDRNTFGVKGEKKNNEKLLSELQAPGT